MLALAVRREQSRHAAQSAARLRSARDRLIGAAFWWGVSFIVPADWRFAAWLAAFIGLFLALWNAEQSWIERRLSREPLRADDLL
jgi:hypothetical protein